MKFTRATIQIAPWLKVVCNYAAGSTSEKPANAVLSEEDKRDEEELEPGEIDIYGQIGESILGDEKGFCAQQFSEAVKLFDKSAVVNLNIHSPGGNIWEAFAIAGMIEARGNITTKVLGIAASSADVIFQAGSKRVMPALAMRMAHDPHSIVAGSSEDMRKEADRLDKHADVLASYYARRSGKTVDECREMMNGESWMGGTESKAAGFCDEVTEDKPVQNVLDLSRFKTAPQGYNENHDEMGRFSDAEGAAGGDSKRANDATGKAKDASAKAKSSNNKADHREAARTNRDAKNAHETAADSHREAAEETEGKERTAHLSAAKAHDRAANTHGKLATMHKAAASGKSNLSQVEIQCELDNLADSKQANSPPSVIMNRDEMLALLKMWGVEAPANCADAEIVALVKKGKPTEAPSNVVDLQARLARVEAESARQHMTLITNRVADLVARDVIPANQSDGWVKDAAKDITILDRLESLPARPPGVASVSSISTVSDSFGDISAAMDRCRAPINSMLKGNEMRGEDERKAIGNGAKSNSKIIAQNSDKLLGVLFGLKRVVENNGTTRYVSVTAPMNDSTYSGVTVSSNLQRQVIMSEAMRAFRRRLLSVSIFSHVFQNTPLQGNDQVVVPYYPLYSTASQRWTGNGYQFPAGGDQALSKTITVGGAGSANKVAGQDRAYQPMTWSAYLIRRQPWIDVLKLAVMRAEQLAVDVVNDIMTAWILRANFGNAVWPGLPAAFDETVVAQIAGVCKKAMWPDGQRNLVIGTDYWVNLVSSPYVKSYMNIGDTGVIREGRVGGLYGFEEVIENPLIPATADGNLIGFAAHPSALLVATAPIMPAPGELKTMVNYDIIVDDQSSLSFEYKYWGEPWNSADREIIECNYGSGLGELAALKRLVAQGN